MSQGKTLPQTPLSQASCAWRGPGIALELGIATLENGMHLEYAVMPNLHSTHQGRKKACSFVLLLLAFGGCPGWPWPPRQDYHRPFRWAVWNEAFRRTSRSDRVRGVTFVRGRFRSLGGRGHMECDTQPANRCQHTCKQGQFKLREGMGTRENLRPCNQKLHYQSNKVFQIEQ